MRDDARSVFQITKSIALDEINWLVGVISIVPSSTGINLI